MPKENSSDLYVETGREYARIDTGSYKILAMHWNSGNVDFHSVKDKDNSYELALYIENKSTDYITFYFLKDAYLTSNLQEQQFQAPYNFDTADARYSYTLEPGTGCYVYLNFNSWMIDEYAIDISEVVTINLPVRVDYIFDDRLESDVISDFNGTTHTIQITRDQLVSK